MMKYLFVLFALVLLAGCSVKEQTADDNVDNLSSDAIDSDINSLDNLTNDINSSEIDNLGAEIDNVSID